MASYKQTIAFFGATGGTGGTCLAKALTEGHHCTALVRVPDKLRNLLTTTHQIAATTIDKFLTIHQGDAKNVLDVAKTLVNPTDETLLVDTIYSSIGAYPKFQFSITMPFPLSEPTICEDGMATLFAAIDQLASRGIHAAQSGRKPFLIVVSATASENLRQSLPLLFVPLYFWLLRSPHNDKLNMEKLIKADKGAHTRSFVIVRPALLTDGAERGLDKLRVGWMWGVDKEGREKEPGPEIGWTISRKDLGAWVFKKAIVEGGWEGRCVSICY